MKKACEWLEAMTKLDSISLDIYWFDVTQAA